MTIRTLKAHLMFGTVLAALVCFVVALLEDSSRWFYAGMVSMMAEWAISDWPYAWPARLHEPLGWNARNYERLLREQQRTVLTYDEVAQQDRLGRL